MDSDIAEEAQSIIQAHSRKYNPEESDENYLYKDQHTVYTPETLNPKSPKTPKPERAKAPKPEGPKALKP